MKCSHKKAKRIIKCFGPTWIYWCPSCGSIRIDESEEHSGKWQIPKDASLIEPKSKDDSVAKGVIECVHCKGSGMTTYDCCIDASSKVQLPPGPIKKAIAGPRKCCVCNGKGFTSSEPPNL